MQIENLPTAPRPEKVKRECGECSLCCKTLSIAEIHKPPGTWCAHAKPGAGGCGIYVDRPNTCQMFDCAWLQDDGTMFPDSFRPSDLKIVCYAGFRGTMIAACDPGFPDAWLKPEFQDWLNRFISETQNKVVIVTGQRRILLEPKKKAQEFKAEDVNELSIGEET